MTTKRLVQVYSAAGILMLISVLASAHEAVVNEHTELITIPTYNPPPAGASVESAVKAANAFIASFDPTFHKIYPVFLFDFADKSRSEWSNLPIRFAPRQGLSLGEMSDEQRSLLFDFLSAALGQEGYESISNTLAAEAFLVAAQGQKSTWMMIAPENHAFSIYGTPSLEGQWGWQFGGHHLAINMSYDRGIVSSISPSFIGTEPAVFTIGGRSFRTNKDMHEAGYAVYAALSAEQKKLATVIAPPEDNLTLGAGSDGKTTPQIGIKASDLNADQKSLLLNAVRQWVEIQPDISAEERMEEIRQEIDSLSFAWWGSDEVNTHAYMRIHGNTVFIELLSMRSNIGSGYGHYHTIYRNPTMEYGIKKRKRL